MQTFARLPFPLWTQAWRAGLLSPQLQRARLVRPRASEAGPSLRVVRMGKLPRARLGDAATLQGSEGRSAPTEPQSGTSSQNFS